MDALLKTCPNRSNRRLAIALKTIRITSMWGAGELVYTTDDGWCGVHLDGEPERAVYEYPAEHVTVQR